MSKRAKWITFGAVVLGIAGFGGMTAARKGQKPVAVEGYLVCRRRSGTAIPAAEPQTGSTPAPEQKPE